MKYKLSPILLHLKPCKAASRWIATMNFDTLEEAVHKCPQSDWLFQLLWKVPSVQMQAIRWAGFQKYGRISLLQKNVRSFFLENLQPLELVLFCYGKEHNCLEPA